MKNANLRLAQGAAIAAVYAAATYLSAVLGIAYGPVQIRLSEALTVLAVFTPAAVPGLTVGCIIGNLPSPLGIWDAVFGAGATFAASVCARKMRNVKIKDLPLPSIIAPVIFNALVVGAEIAFLLPGAEPSLAFFALSALRVGAGEAAVCVFGGIPLFYALRKSAFFK